MSQLIIEKLIESDNDLIISDVKIARLDRTKIIIAKALWDTGSTNTTISSRIVEELSLEKTGLIECLYGSGTSILNTYSAEIIFEEIEWVFESNVLAAGIYQDGQIYDIIIGMNLIRQGNFNLTRTCNNQLLFSFSR